MSEHFDSTVRITVVDGTTKHETYEGKAREMYDAERKARQSMQPEMEDDYIDGWPVLPHDQWSVRVLGDLFDYEVRWGLVC